MARAHSVIRVPIGAYGSGGPYSSSIESVLTAIRGIKVAYPSCGADLKGLLKSAVDDPNPVVVLEHKGLYWSKVPGTEAAKTIETNADYRLPSGKARIVQPWAMTSKSRPTWPSSPTAGVSTGLWRRAKPGLAEWKSSISGACLRSMNPPCSTAPNAATAVGPDRGTAPGQLCPGLADFDFRLSNFQHLDYPVRTLGSMEVHHPASTRPSKPLSSPMPPRWLQPSRNCSFTGSS